MKKRSSRSEKLFWFFYRKQEDEQLDPDIIHLCFTKQEFADSPYKNIKDIRYWSDVFFYQLMADQLYFCNPDSYEAQSAILTFIYQFDRKEED